MDELKKAGNARAALAVGSVVAALAIAGCAEYQRLDTAVAEYKEKDPDALGDLKSIDAGYLSRPLHTRHAIFLGLAYFRAYRTTGAESDLREAEKYLRQGVRELADTELRVLSPNEERDLKAALASLESEKQSAGSAGAAK